MIYKGTALDPDGIQRNFTSNDDFHALDGLKVDRIMFAANISSQADIEALMDFLQTAKFCLERESPSKDKFPLPYDYAAFFNQYKSEL